MTTGAVSGSTSQQSSSNNYGDYIPKTSPWDVENLCEFTPARNVEARQRCCSSPKTIDRAINKAYRNGIQWHPGIKAIQDYPCITEKEMGKLSNDLHKKARSSKVKIELPEGIDPTEKPGKVTKKILDYCKEVVFERLARELDRFNNNKPIAFTNDIVRYCKHAVTLTPSAIDTSTYTNWGS